MSGRMILSSIAHTTTRRCACSALGLIAAEHGFVDAVDVFPAVPAPIAVLLGRERLMKRHPALRLHDADKVNGGFQFQLEVT